MIHSVKDRKSTEFSRSWEKGNTSSIFPNQNKKQNTFYMNKLKKYFSLA